MSFGTFLFQTGQDKLSMEVAKSLLLKLARRIPIILLINSQINQNTEGACADAAIFCGIRDKLYPDKRSMGYPFDRMPRDGVNTLKDFLTPNMFVRDVSIKFTNRTVGVQGGDEPNRLTWSASAANHDKENDHCFF